MADGNPGHGLKTPGLALAPAPSLEPQAWLFPPHQVLLPLPIHASFSSIPHITVPLSPPVRTPLAGYSLSQPLSQQRPQSVLFLLRLPH